MPNLTFDISPRPGEGNTLHRSLTKQQLIGSPPPNKDSLKKKPHLRWNSLSPSLSEPPVESTAGHIAHTTSTSSHNSGSGSSCATGQSPALSPAFSRGGSEESCEILAHSQTLSPPDPLSPLPTPLSESLPSSAQTGLLFEAPPSWSRPPLAASETCLR